MADNITVPVTGSGTATPVVATDDVAGVHFQKVKLDLGGDGASVPTPGDAANGMDVDVTRLPALPAGTNNIGDVDIASPKEDADTGAGTRDAIPVVLVKKTSGAPDLGTATDPLRTDPTGTTTQPVSVALALPAGTNNIGDVDLASALPAGTNKIGGVDLDSDATPGSAVPSAAQYVVGTDGTNARGLKTDANGELQIDVLSLPALPAGPNNIGDVDVASLPTSATTTAPAQTAVGTTAVQLLASNASRKRFMVQNTGTTIIKLAFGATDPTGTAYHVALAAGSGADDGKGGFYLDELWVGRVAAISSGAGGTVVITELT